MKLIIAPDSFKEALSSNQVADAIRRGWLAVRPGDQVRTIPVADGGEGTCEAWFDAVGGTWMTTDVVGPIGEDRVARWLLLKGGQTAVIECAASSGLALVPPLLRDPRLTTSYGVGQMMRHALDNGAKRLVIGLGGSATNDGGAGMFQALGGSLLDGAGDELPFGGAALAELARIDASGLDPRIRTAEILAATDVENPLLGCEGASAIFGPQKGATPEMVLQLDQALTRLHARFVADLGQDVADRPGAGAAGGLGGGLMAFCGATRHSGAELVLEASGFTEALRDCDLVITGEGRIDHQTASGKIIRPLTHHASESGVPVVALVGAMDEAFTYTHARAMGLRAVLPIGAQPQALEAALASTASNLERTAAMLASLYGGHED